MAQTGLTADGTARRTQVGRAVLIGVALLALIATVATLPVVIIIVAMNLDTPSVRWNLLHVSMLGLPAALLACTGAAAWGAISARLKLLWVAVALLATDMVALTILWHRMGT